MEEIYGKGIIFSPSEMDKRLGNWISGSREVVLPESIDEIVSVNMPFYFGSIVSGRVLDVFRTYHDYCVIWFDGLYVKCKGFLFTWGGVIEVYLADPSAKIVEERVETFHIDMVLDKPMVKVFGFYDTMRHDECARFEWFCNERVRGIVEGKLVDMFKCYNELVAEKRRCNEYQMEVRENNRRIEECRVTREIVEANTVGCSVID
jgi:hypothetical protein